MIGIEGIYQISSEFPMLRHITTLDSREPKGWVPYLRDEAIGSTPVRGEEESNVKKYKAILGVPASHRSMTCFNRVISKVF